MIAGKWLLAFAYLALAWLPAGAAFDRLAESSACEALCGAGPGGMSYDLMAPSRQGDWTRLRAMSGELYGLSELGIIGVGVSARRGDTVLALTASSLGGALLRERAVAVAVGRRVGDAAAGIEIRALCMGWRGGSDVWSGTVDLHGAWLVAGRLVFGATVRNAAAARILSSPVAASVSCGAALCLDGVTLHGSVRGEDGFAPSPAVGVELELAPWLCLRSGLRLDPASCGVGLGLGAPDAGGPGVDLACEWHPVLGLSSSLTVSFQR